jgi:predicted nucleotidyltransferase
MAGLDHRTEALIEKFAGELQTALGQRLKSVVLYGSAVRGDFIPGRSDLNFMVVVDNLDFEVLAGLTGRVRHFWRKRVSTPLVVDEHYIRRSLDVFPLEFSEMKTAYKVVSGKDPIADLVVAPADLRLQCEAELKRKLLLLREAYLEAQNKRGRIEFLLQRSLKSFLVVLRNLLPLLGEESGGGAPEELIASAEDKLGVELKSFRRIFEMKGRRLRLGKSEREALMAEYLAEVRTLAQAVDMLNEDKGGEAG